MHIVTLSEHVKGLRENNIQFREERFFVSNVADICLTCDIYRNNWSQLGTDAMLFLLNRSRVCTGSMR